MHRAAHDGSVVAVGHGLHSRHCGVSVVVEARAWFRIFQELFLFGRVGFVSLGDQQPADGRPLEQRTCFGGVLEFVWLRGILVILAWPQFRANLRLASSCPRQENTALVESFFKRVLIGVLLEVMTRSDRVVLGAFVFLAANFL